MPNRVINTGMMSNIAGQMEKNLQNGLIEEIANIANNCVIKGLGSLSEGGITNGLASNVNSEYGALVNDLKRRVDNYRGKITEIKKELVKTNLGVNNNSNSVPNHNNVTKNQNNTNIIDKQNNNSQKEIAPSDYSRDSEKFSKYRDDNYKYETIDNGNGEIYVNTRPEGSPAHYNVYDANTGKLKGTANQYVFENGMNNGNRTSDAYANLRGSDYNRDMNTFASQKNENYQYKTVDNGNGEIYVNTRPEGSPAYYNVYDANTGKLKGTANQYVFENGMNNGNRTSDAYANLRGSDYNRDMNTFASLKNENYQYKTVENSDGKIYVNTRPEGSPAYYNVYDANTGKALGGVSQKNIDSKGGFTFKAYDGGKK